MKRRSMFTQALEILVIEGLGLALVLNLLAYQATRDNRTAPSDHYADQLPRLPLSIPYRPMPAESRWPAREYGKDWTPWGAP